MIYSRSSRNLPASPSTRAPRTGYPNSSRDPPFLVLSRFLRSEWLSPISSFYAYALNFRLPAIPFPDRSFRAFLVTHLETCLYKTVAVFQIRANSPMSVALLLRSLLSLVFYPIPIRTVPGLFPFCRGLSLSLFLARVFVPIRLVLLTWLLARPAPSRLTALYVPLTGFHDGRRRRLVFLKERKTDRRPRARWY